MAALFFPKSVPNARTLSYLLDIEREYVVAQNGQLILEPGHSQLIMPTMYQKTMASFLWRDAAIRSVLLHAGELKIPSTLTDNLTMVLWYMDDVFNATLREFKSSTVMNADFRSKTFDQYLTIEYWIRRHEPKNVNAFPLTPDHDINNCGEHARPSNCSLSNVYQIGTPTLPPWDLYGLERRTSSSSAQRKKRSKMRRSCCLKCNDFMTLQSNGTTPVCIPSISQ